MKCLACETEMVTSKVWQCQSNEHPDVAKRGYTFSLFSNIRQNIIRLERKRITLDVWVCPNCGEVRLKMNPLDLKTYKRTCHIKS